MEAMTNAMKPEQLFAAFDLIIRSMPDRTKIKHELPANEEWFGQAAAAVNLADPMRGAMFKSDVKRLFTMSADHGAAFSSILITLQQLRAEYRMLSAGPLTLAFEAGKPFDYFDEVRKIIETATSDMLVVDPYLGADFVARYLPFVKEGVSIRLLIESKITEVTEAVALYAKQHGASIELRKSKGLHDRFIFIDKRECYHSGASFKDGALFSATVLSQITDAFSSVLSTYEDSWSSARI